VRFSTLPVQSLTRICRPLPSPKKRQARRKPKRNRTVTNPVTELDRFSAPFDSDVHDGNYGDVLDHYGDYQEPFEDEAEGMTLPQQISEIEMLQRTDVPRYWEMLQWSATNYARISSRSYVLQDWNPVTQQLKVL
jgi:hypothetical protein